MIRAHMASYPPRQKMLFQSVASIIDQVDMLFLCLNQYSEVPAALSANPKIKAFIPEEDQKDVGKFITTPEPDDLVFLVDDDLIFREDFASHMLTRLDECGPEKAVIGTLATTYTTKAPESISQREVTRVGQKVRRPKRVDQLATCGMVALGCNVAPYEYMKDSQKFVDVRYARWLFEHGIESWAVDRRKGFISEIPVSRSHETIYRTFTRQTPDRVLAEIGVFAARISAGTPQQ
ncbi:hypothetical protein RKLH11_2055 [Rhodobacteraceae bacterium KLH11]|nr:hypothetical protein RKLH11_2055 [Rhodobacteraceae bacterium KLH11]